MFEVHKNISGQRFVYVWEVTATFRNRTLAYEECERLRAEGFWAVVHENDNRDISRELDRDAKTYTKRYSREFKNWRADSYGAAEIHSANMEVVFEAFTEYQSEKFYW